MSAHPLFDQFLGGVLRDKGMGLAADHRAEVLECAKEFARELAKDGEVTIDDVYRELDELWPISLLGNAAGSVFKGPDWEFTGRWVKSQRVTNHGRWIRVWRLK